MAFNYSLLFIGRFTHYVDEKIFHFFVINHMPHLFLWRLNDFGLHMLYIINKAKNMIVHCLFIIQEAQPFIIKRCIIDHLFSMWISIMRMAESYEYKINKMSHQHMYDLPKVKLRFKTTPCESNTIQTNDTLPIFKQYSATPSIFLERIKMGKEIQDSYLRFRRKKKNNYIKRFESQKKSMPMIEDKRISTLVVRDKPKLLVNQFELTLENAQEKEAIQTTCLRRTRVRDEMGIFKRDNRDDDRETSDIHRSHKPISNPKLYQASEVSSFYNSFMRMRERKSIPIELMGTKCNYEINDRKKGPCSLKEDHRARLTRRIQSSSFKIQAWKQENDRMKGEYQEIQLLE